MIIYALIGAASAIYVMGLVATFFLMAMAKFPWFWVLMCLFWPIMWPAMWLHGKVMR